MLTVIIVSWNTKELLRRCLHSLFQDLAGKEAQVYVVDNNSADKSAQMVAEEFPQAKLIANDENLGFGRANNQVLNKVDSDFYLLLNPDTEVLPGSIATLQKFMAEHPKAGIVAPQLLNSDRTIQRFCRAFPTFFDIVA